MYNDLFSIGPLTVHTYGLMTAVGILAAYWLAERRAKQRHLADRYVEKILGLAVACVVCGFAGSKLLFLLTILPKLISGELTLSGSFSGGWVIFGGLLGGLLGGSLYCKWQKLNVWTYYDLVMPAVALAQGFGRIGCLAAGCCYGVETTGPLYLEFSQSHFGPNHVHLVPTQPIMSIGDFLLCAALLLYGKKLQKHEGELVGVYLTLYSAGRFIVEFWRGDLIRGQVGPLSTSQFIGLFTVAAGVILWMYVRKKNPAAAAPSMTEAARPTAS